MHSPGVEHTDSIFRDELATIDKVFRSDVRCTESEGVVDSLHFLNDRMTVWQVGFIFNVWHTVETNDSIELSLGFLLDFRIGRNQSREPLHDGRSL
jgi:hypothetical protein